MKQLLFILLAFFIKINTFAFSLSPEAQISLLTCSPGEEVYAKFGHTALRVNDAPNGIDEVFNYGIFDFSSDSFLFRFVKGETDYMLGTTPFAYLVWEYESRGSAVEEQVLNLNQTEKQTLFDALLSNSLPENRTYRYNYFFDNCTTRPRLLIEQAVHNLVYAAVVERSQNDTASKEKESFRSEIYRMVGEGTWLGFGIDLLIGGRADEPFREQEHLFLPDNLMLTFAQAKINRDGDMQPLVSETRTVVAAGREGARLVSTSAISSPLLWSWVVLAVVALLSFFLYKKNKPGAWLDIPLFSLAGIIGSLILFLVLFSEHPAVSPNYNLLWAHPLHLLFALFILPFKSLRRTQRYYHSANVAVLLATLLLYPFIPQHFHPAFFPLILALLLRSTMRIIWKKQ
jgi:hypothetical protein